MRFFAAIALLLLHASIGRGESEIFNHPYLDSDGPRLVTGSPLIFTLTGEGMDPISFSVNVPSVGPVLSITEINIYEADAGTRGIDWKGLESALAGPGPKLTNWAQPNETSQLLLFEDQPGYYLGSVDLTRIRLRFLSLSFGILSPITFFGEFTVAPEPSSGFIGIYTVCSGLLVGRRRNRAFFKSHTRPLSSGA